MVEEHHYRTWEGLVEKLKGGIRVGKNLLICEYDCESYIQYNRRYPSNRTDSVHYEIGVDKDNECFTVVFHIEKGTDSSIRDQLSNEIRSKAERVSELITRRSRHQNVVKVKAGKVYWTPIRNVNEVYHEICQKMELLYTTFEPIIAKYEKHK